MDPEFVPLQGGYERFVTQPNGPTVIQSTTVNIITDPPQDHIIWSLCCFCYYNPFCLGLAALIFSIKSRDRKVAGDLEGARHYGSTARSLNIASSILAGIGLLIIVITIITIIVIINQSASYAYKHNYPYNRY
uniref:dispanin subfamily A member 2b-like n=1 Tax=Semicossyphus pulcher TaxID=241346 RepID=UPI0037E74AEE